MKTDILSQGGKEKECTLRESSKESVLHSSETEIFGSSETAFLVREAKELLLFVRYSCKK